MKKIFLFLLASSVMVDTQRTTIVTKTSTSTKTSVVTVASSIVCAKLVNVTGACRRYRGFLIDDPTILTFDEELDESIDFPFQQALHPKFMPTRTLRHFYGQSRGEMTPAMQLPNHSNQQQQSFAFYHPNFNSPTTSDGVESSIKETNKRFNQYKIANNYNDNPESRIYFSQIAAIANAIANQLRPPITVTSTATVTITQTSRTTLVRTLSFFILGCTPNPFPFATCPVKRILG